jgi:hypothetical protein
MLLLHHRGQRPICYWLGKTMTGHPLTIAYSIRDAAGRKFMQTTLATAKETVHNSNSAKGARI